MDTLGRMVKYDSLTCIYDDCVDDVKHTFFKCIRRSCKKADLLYEIERQNLLLEYLTAIMITGAVE